MAGTLSIGAKCQHLGCNQVDFLPIACNLCSLQFCRYHAIADAHSCEKLPVSGNLTESTPRAKCDFEKCAQLSLSSHVADNKGSSARCSACNRSFCATHPDEHRCESEDKIKAPPVKNPEGMALLAKHFGTPAPRAQSSSSSTSTGGIKNKQILLMKLRSKATAADQSNKSARYTPQDCILARVLKDDKEQVFWFKKTVSAGKAIDLLANRLGVRITDDRRVVLERTVGESTTTLANEKLLSDQMEDGDLLALR